MDTPKRKPGRPPRMEKPESTEKETGEQTREELLKEIQKYKMEKEQLEKKLLKKREPEDVPTRQHRSDVVSQEEMRQEESRKVKGTFRCFQPPGGGVEFYFRKYKGDPIEKYTLKDGEQYELPLAVVRHLNENCFEEKKTYLLDANGQPIRGVGKKEHRFSFTSSDYGRLENVSAAANYA